MRDCAREWAIWMTGQKSVTGTDGERNFPSVLLERIAARPSLADAECWLIPVPGDPLERSCAAVLVRGEGLRTVLLTGHFDTVTCNDYGDLADLATEPEPLMAALAARLADPRTPAEARAKADFASGSFLPGRGLLDMKAGLAAGLAALEAFAAAPSRSGNLLLVAVPDEEVNSVGARALAQATAEIMRERGLDIAATINLDAIADDGDGSKGRAIALGSVGKLLLTALVVGQPSHACYPFNGLNAAALAATLATAVEWSPELADAVPGQAGMPPTLLSLKDGKTGYDVTTPASVFAIWNALTLTRGSDDLFAAFRKIAGQALGELAGKLAERRRAVTGEEMCAPAIPILTASELLAKALARQGGEQRIADAAVKAANAGFSLPEQCRIITEAAFAASGLAGPAVVLGFGSLPYPAVHLSDGAAAKRLLASATAAARSAERRGSGAIRVEPFFQGISDMSFLGEASTDAVPLIAANTPAWETGVRWAGVVAGIPTVNIGPWGRDYHTPLERLYTPYAFDHLPLIVFETARHVLSDDDPPA